MKSRNSLILLGFRLFICILYGKDVYLATLERAHCRQLWQEQEYDWEHPTEEVGIGLSVENADAWFEDIQRRQGNGNLRLGIFLHDGTVIGDVALQDLDAKNRSCSVGMGIVKRQYRSHGYGRQALGMMLYLGFGYAGMERITANTLEMNIGAQKSLERCGFVLKGRERQAIYLYGRKWDRLRYALLKEEYTSMRQEGLYDEA